MLLVRMGDSVERVGEYVEYGVWSVEKFHNDSHVNAFFLKLIMLLLTASRIVY